MGEASDIEALLQGHFETEKKKRRLGWVKMLAILVSSFSGAGWSVHGYLNTIATKEDVAKLINGQQEQLKTVIESEQVLANRMTAVEGQTGAARECCHDQTRRVDILFQQPLQVRR